MSELITRIVAEQISSRSEIGELRRRCDAYAELNEKWKKKTQMLKKSVAQLNFVVKRFENEAKSGRKNPAPVKITRSVGLQVSLVIELFQLFNQL